MNHLARHSASITAVCCCITHSNRKTTLKQEDMKFTVQLFVCLHAVHLKMFFHYRVITENNFCGEKQYVVDVVEIDKYLMREKCLHSIQYIFINVHCVSLHFSNNSNIK